MRSKEQTDSDNANRARKVLNVPEPAHQFREPEDIARAVGGEQLLVDLVGTRAFQRLRKVHFLGAIDYSEVPYPHRKSGRTRYTRYEHSIGVMQLALRYAELRELTMSRRRVLCAAALLHDIGHPPLSHSLELVFEQALGMNHHSVSIDIIRGRNPLGAQVLQTLHDNSVDVDELTAVLSGQDAEFEGFFSGPVNFDTIEGILRSYRYRHDSPTCLDPALVTEAATLRETTRHREIVDDFWKHKNWVYHNLINSKRGILSDHVCRTYLQERIAEVDESWFFIDEKELFKRLDGLKELLRSDTFERRALGCVDHPITFTRRDYFVDDSGDFFHWEDALRYRNTRRRTELRTKVEGWGCPGQMGREAQKELFR